MVKRTGIGSHTLPNQGATDDWITPKYLIDDLGPFDLDPCQSLTQPWPCANKGYTIHDDGLSKSWANQFVFVNSPYSRIQPFMARLAEQRYGIGLLFGRTETKMFIDHIWEEATAILFVAGRLHFHYPDPQNPQHCHRGGEHVWTGRPEHPKKLWCCMCGQAKGNSGGPSAFVAYGDRALQRLQQSSVPGALVTQWEFRRHKGK